MTTPKGNATVFVVLVRKISPPFKVSQLSSVSLGTPLPLHTPPSQSFFTFCRVVAQYFAFFSSPVLFLLVRRPLLCLSDKMQRKFRFMKNENEYQEVSSSGKQILHGRNAARSRGRRNVQGCLGTTANDCPFISTFVRAANKAEVPGSRSHGL